MGASSRFSVQRNGSSAADESLTRRIMRQEENATGWNVGGRLLVVSNPEGFLTRPRARQPGACDCRHFAWALRAGCPRHVAARLRAAGRARPVARASLPGCPCLEHMLAHAWRMCRAWRADAFTLHGHCGRRHASTACRGTRQPRHVLAFIAHRHWAPSARRACPGDRSRFDGMLAHRRG